MKDQFNNEIKLNDRVLLNNQNYKGKQINFQYGKVIGFTNEFVIIQPDNPNAFIYINKKNRNKIYRYSYNIIVDNTEQLTNNWLRLAAEIDNYKKNNDKRSTLEIQNNTNKIMLSMLEVLDDIERGIQIDNNDGLKIIKNKFINTLSKFGVKEIDTKPNENNEYVNFNPEFHEAITVVDSDYKNKIIDTLQKGYTINDKLLRVAKVIVGVQK